MRKKQKPPRVRHFPLTVARKGLGALLQQVHRKKDYVILERDGLPVAALMDVDEFEDYLELHDVRVRRDIRASAKEFREGKGRPAERLLALFNAEGERHREGRRRARLG